LHPHSSLFSSLVSLIFALWRSDARARARDLPRKIYVRVEESRDRSITELAVCRLASKKEGCVMKDKESIYEEVSKFGPSWIEAIDDYGRGRRPTPDAGRHAGCSQSPRDANPGRPHRKLISSTYYTMMKLFVVSTSLLIIPIDGFVPLLRQVVKAGPASILKNTKKLDEISHELEELGGEIKPQVMQERRGFNEYHETLVHKLRRAVHEKDELMRDALEELQDALKTRQAILDLTETMHRIEETLEESKAYAVAWETAEVELKKEMEERGDMKENRELLRDLQYTLERIESRLAASKAYALAWETAEVEVQREKGLYEQEHKKLENEKELNVLYQEEHESIRRLLWQAAKLTFRKAKNVVRRLLFLKPQ
jgi:hypothetical protein